MNFIGRLYFVLLATKKHTWTKFLWLPSLSGGEDKSSKRSGKVLGITFFISKGPWISKEVFKSVYSLYELSEVPIPVEKDSDRDSR